MLLVVFHTDYGTKCWNPSIVPTHEELLPAAMAVMDSNVLLVLLSVRDSLVGY